MIVLDTHTLLWWASGDEAQLSAAAAQAIAAELHGGQSSVSPRPFPAHRAARCSSRHALAIT